MSAATGSPFSEDRRHGAVQARIELERASGGVYVRRGSASAVRELEPAIVQRRGQGGADGAGFRRSPQFDDETSDRRSSPPLPHQTPRDAEGEGDERPGLVAPEALIERVVAEDPARERVLEIPGHEPEVGEGRHDDGEQDRCHPAGADESPHEQDAASGDPRDGDAQSIQVERSEETVVRANEDEVRGTVVAARRLRVEHCRREEPEQKERTCVGRRDRRGVRNRPKPSSRIGERRVGDDRHARDERDETDRESERALDSGIREPRQEPHKASGGDQQPELVTAVSGREDDPGGDERPAAGEVRDCARGRGARERVRRIPPRHPQAG